MRNSLEIGDEVTTIGGIIGRVIAIKEDTFVMETGSDRTKIRFRRAAIQAVEKLNLDPAAAPRKEINVLKEHLPAYDVVCMEVFFMSKNNRPGPRPAQSA